MKQVTFDVEQLNQKDRKVYNAMSEYEKKMYESAWINLQNTRLRMEQMKNHSKERNRREAQILSERQRKERTHRLIERGAMFESFFEVPESLSNYECMKILKELFSSVTGRKVLERYQKAEIQTDNAEDPEISNDGGDSSVYLA